jgi:hypothetical protein
MTDIQKFLADARRIIKYDRADHNGMYDGYRASASLAQLFIRENLQLAPLPEYIAKYWQDTYIATAPDGATEPSEEHIDWLAAILSLFDGDQTARYPFSATDWTELRDLVSCEAEDIPLDILSSMMSIFIENGAF